MTPAREFGCDGFHRVELTVAVDDEVGLVIAEDHRIGNI
jgi:hypothetical protein